LLLPKRLLGITAFCLSIYTKLIMHMLQVAFLAASIPLAWGAQRLAIETRLTPEAIGDFDAVAFANVKARSRTARPRCKAFPGDPEWPTDDEWSRLNKTLGGALLKPFPPASVCYTTSPNFNAEACSFLLNNASRTSFYLDDPVTVLTLWPQGNTCLPPPNPAGNCTQGGYPVYVVNATTVKHVQAAVNFARNKNVRLIIKSASLPPMNIGNIGVCPTRLTAPQKHRS
jgi:hypothetical protein